MNLDAFRNPWLYVVVGGLIAAAVYLIPRVARFTAAPINERKTWDTPRLAHRKRGLVVHPIRIRWAEVRMV